MANQSKRVGTLAGALAKDPRGGRVSTMPVGNPGAAGSAAGAAVKRAELQRVSPGVYRNAQGGLVNSRGGSLPGQRPQQPQRPSMNVPAPRPQRQPGPGQFQPADPSQYPIGQRQPAGRPTAPNAGQNGNGMEMNIPPEAYNQWVESAVMPEMDRGRPPMGWDLNGNGSPNNFNQWSQPSNPQGQINDLMYRYPQGQSPNFGEMFRYFEQQRQQPNTVSGMLQQGIVANREPIAPQGQLSPAELQARQNGTFKGYNY